ncbi:MAG: hypothetical protein HQL32_01295 [Planctomycetes bacterium]|nr:hypothetical protein [Planctomycetota bacterium]
MKRLIIILLLLCPFMPAAEEKSPSEVLELLHESYYDYDKFGLNRAACYVYSREFLSFVDPKVSKFLRRAKYEAVIKPGEPITVQALKIPVEYNEEGKEGLKGYAKAIEDWLNEVHGHVDNVRKAMSPDGFLKDVPFQWKEGKEGRVMFFGEKPLFGNLDVVKSDKEPQKESFEIHLTRSGQLDRFIARKADHTEDMDFKVKKISKSWLLEEIDVTKTDLQGRVLERNEVKFSYASKNKIYLIKKIMMRILDAKGRITKRRDRPNPVSLDFTNYIVEVR